MRISNSRILGWVNGDQSGRWLRSVAALACGLALIVLSFTATAAAQKAKKGTGGGGGGVPQATDVTTTLNDSTSSAIYQLGSDGNGPYVNYSSAKDSVSSIIQQGGDWVLDTKTSTTRSVSITLVPDPSNEPNSPFSGPITLPTRFIMKCHLVVTNGFFAIQPGGSIDCLMSTTFVYAGNNYHLAMNSANFPETNYVHVTCTGGDSSGVCNAWKITPQPGTGYSVGLLQVQGDKVRGTTTWVNIGYYDVNFSFKVTNP